MRELCQLVSLGTHTSFAQTALVYYVVAWSMLKVYKPAFWTPAARLGIAVVPDRYLYHYPASAIIEIDARMTMYVLRVAITSMSRKKSRGLQTVRESCGNRFLEIESVVEVELVHISTGQSNFASCIR